MTRIGSIFAFALVALLASLALVDARLPPVVATGGGVVQATPAPKPVYVRSEESSPAGGSTPQDLNDRADPATRAPLDDDEGAPTHATTTTTRPRRQQTSSDRSPSATIRPRTLSPPRSRRRLRSARSPSSSGSPSSPPGPPAPLPPVPTSTMTTPTAWCDSSPPRR